MCSTKRYIIALFFILPANHLPAQDITGTWEGDLGTYQFLQLSIIQNGDKICGYSWDYIKADQKDHCKAYFQGHYDKKQKQWIIEGTDFIENSGSHTLMTLNLGERLRKGNETLNGISVNRGSILTWFFGDDSLSLKEKDDLVFLKKISSKPYAVLEQMMDCYLKKNKSFDTTAKSKIPILIPDSAVTRPPPVVTQKDSVNIVKDSVTIPKQLVKRKNTEQSHIEVNVKSITLNVYDNAIVDGDTISVFYNGKLLLSHQRLSEKPIVINLELDEKQIRQEIILFAENLGSIPPNTALIVIYAGDKRYELFSSASLQENAVLVFDYKPK